MDHTFTCRLGRDDYVALLRANRAMSRLGSGRAALIAGLCIAFIWTFSSASRFDHPWRNLLITASHSSSSCALCPGSNASPTC